MKAERPLRVTHVSDAEATGRKPTAELTQSGLAPLAFRIGARAVPRPLSEANDLGLFVAALADMHLNAQTRAGRVREKALDAAATTTMRTGSRRKVV
jgi:hypothetical protein